ncbi:cell wall assembly regulator SMI1 [Paenibacillus phyllosphaerae]|uniref:Cell wall assembly regulator SMI1 n=1 Tax=Paenibacillus phyllosphaerae TaxID=274593 RepID=A0A7W5FPZ9_9BACL|nr:SMI1/KNR4 family protein [Paenibacillus phyllosphaerae]MBB3112707.1 cell wall assembly regulator SMI1 [Paenibacillus phyllosphaerae]
MVQNLVLELQQQLKSAVPNLKWNGPADESLLREFEAYLGFPLPSDLRTLYSLHNGQPEHGPGLFFGMNFIPLYPYWRYLRDEDKVYLDDYPSFSVPFGAIKEHNSNPRWLPIAHDHGGNYLGVDLDPGERGKLGQIINFGRDEETKYVIAESMTDFLLFILHTLQKKQYTVEEEEGHTLWGYGSQADAHFLDVIRKLPLPYPNPQQVEHGLTDIELWHKTLSPAWQHCIADAGPSIEQNFLLARSLRLSRDDLTDMEPLRYCKDLRELSVHVGQIEDLGPLQQLPYLKAVNMGSVRSLESLRHAAELQTLRLHSEQVIDLTPLAGLMKLKKLDITSAAIEDLSPLRTLTGLRTLNISGDKGATDLTAIGQLSGVTKLTIEQANLDTLDFLLGCPSLKNLILIQTTVKDASALGALPALQDLELRSSPVGSLASLSASQSLRIFSGSYEQFDLLKDVFDRPINFSMIIGEMTDEQSAAWRSYVNAASSTYEARDARLPRKISLIDRVKLFIRGLGKSR